MEAISLKKVTAVVAICLLGALVANANANETKLSTVASEAANNTLTTQVGKFQALLKEFDKDNNGSLSQSEIAASSSELLIKSFTSIDTNADLDVSEQEFNQFLALASK